MTSIDNFIIKFNSQIINPLIAFLFALAVMYFLYGVAQFIMNQENEEAKSTGKQHMIWGIVGITIMLGVWTILGIIISTFGITDVNPQGGTVNINLPQ